MLTTHSHTCTLQIHTLKYTHIHAHTCSCMHVPCTDTHAQIHNLAGFQDWAGLGWVGGEIQFGVGDGSPGRACTKRVGVGSHRLNSPVCALSKHRKSCLQGRRHQRLSGRLFWARPALQARFPPPGGGVWSGPGALFLGADWDGGALGCAWAAPPEIPGPSSLVIFVLSGLNQALSGIQGHRRGLSVLLGPQAGERRGEGHAGGTWMHKPIAGGSDFNMRTPQTVPVSPPALQPGCTAGSVPASMFPTPNSVSNAVSPTLSSFSWPLMVPWVLGALTVAAPLVCCPAVTWLPECGPLCPCA